MAMRLNGSTQYAWVNATPIVTFPFTLAVWANLDELPTAHGDEMVAMLLKDGANSLNNWCNLRADDTVADEAVQSNIKGTGATAVAEASGQVTALTWEHYCGIHESATIHAAYMNGGNKGTSVTSASSVNFTRIFLGVFRGTSLNDYFDGRMAEIGLWNVALTDAEVASLGAGYSPLFVRPQSLVAYWPLIRDFRCINNATYNLTGVNTPTFDAHIPIIYPYNRPNIYNKTIVAAGDGQAFRLRAIEKY